jgi:hypothetical protein
MTTLPSFCTTNLWGVVLLVVAVLDQYTPFVCRESNTAHAAK